MEAKERLYYLLKSFCEERNLKLPSVSTIEESSLKIKIK